MIVKSSSKENNTVTFQVELDPAEFEKHVDAAYKKNRGRIQVPGFRRGKASRMVIEGFYGKDVFYEDAMEDAANEAFVFGVEQEKLRAVGRPSLTDMNVTDEKGALLGFSTDVWPEVTLGQYKGLEAEKDPCEVTGEEIDREIDALAAELRYAVENDYQQPADFYGVGGMKIFRDLIYTMQGLMREDHRFYKKHGFYDFPQKRAGMIAGMYLVGSMMNNRKLAKKIGANMTKGMLMPYQSVIGKAKRKK